MLRREKLLTIVKPPSTKRQSAHYIILEDAIPLFRRL
jgi:hypothetical protein